MELKLNFGVKGATVELPFNRTRMELKRALQNAAANSKELLIEPEWN